MGSETIGFQSEKVWEWSLEELWCVICNGVVCMRLCKRGEEKRCLEIWAARYIYFSKYGE